MISKQIIEAVVDRCSWENTHVGVFFNKVVGPQACNFIKERLQHGCFPVIHAKILRTPF